VQQVDVLLDAGSHDADLLPPHLLDVLAQAGQRADDLHLAEAVRQLRGPYRVRATKPRREQHVLLLLLFERVQPFE
jgi:hypothetical protein